MSDFNPVEVEEWFSRWRTSADMVYCRTTDGHIIDSNLPFARKFGRTTSALAGIALSELVHADDWASFDAAVAQVALPPHRLATEQRWLTPHGVRWLAWEETAVHDASGTLVAIGAIGRDITRQHLAEEQFYRLSRAVEQSPVAIVITDPNGRPQYVNSKFTEVSGHTLETVLDRRLEVLREGHPDEASHQQMWDAIRRVGEWKGELVTRRSPNQTIYESVKVTCLRNPAGEVTNLLCLREDVTERRQLELELRQAQKMESLGTLAGGIAHDFNNLLAIISGYADVCQQSTTESAVLKKGLREIGRAAERASGLVQQILMFSRKSGAHLTGVDVNQLSRDLVALLAETFPRTINFNVELAEDLPVLRADNNQLQQVVLNFCVNARDAMPNGGTITLKTSVQDGASLQRLGAAPNRRYVCLQVADTGVGISAEVRQRIFEPFFTTKQAHGGTGLGLSVVYGIVVSHQGFIDVESAPNAGSRFSVYLPVPNETVAGAALTVANQAFPGGTESLLIVDDEPPLRALLETALARKGYRVHTADSGSTAIQFLAENRTPIHLVLLDLNMPGATGLDVYKFIRAHRPDLKAVIVSGHLTSQMRTEFEALGLREFVQKPYKLDDVGRRVRALLDAPV